MDYFHDKVALISGGSRGVGFATARELVSRGAKVVISARGEERLEKSRAELVGMGGEAVSVAGDVGKWEDCRNMVRAAIRNFGKLDILVNNAGISMRGKFAELSPQVCATVTQTNLMGCLYLSRAAADHLIESKGHLVFVSSIAGIFGLPVASVYCATKKALTGLAESLRIEMIPLGMHVGVVYLGYTEHDPEKRIITADGSLTPPDRPAHHTQAHAARLIVKMIEKRRKQLIMTAPGVIGWMAYKLSPAVVEKIVLWAQSGGWGLFKRFS